MTNKQEEIQAKEKVQFHGSNAASKWISIGIILTHLTNAIYHQQVLELVEYIYINNVNKYSGIKCLDWHNFLYNMD